ncbi:MAG: hypothetical protein IGS23_18865 [Rivularia sp. T60_A2020_040]|nr:hypothetical protein [Rivularia sp. T60_A2020_040]
MYLRINTVVLYGKINVKSRLGRWNIVRSQAVSSARDMPIPEKLTLNWGKNPNKYDVFLKQT